MNYGELTVRPLFNTNSKLSKPSFKNGIIIPLSVEGSILIDIIQLTFTVFSEIKTYKIDIFMSMHAGCP